MEQNGNTSILGGDVEIKRRTDGQRDCPLGLEGFYHYKQPI